MDMQLKAHDFIYRQNELTAEVKVYFDFEDGFYYFEDLAFPGLLTRHDQQGIMALYGALGDTAIRSGL